MPYISLSKVIDSSSNEPPNRQKLPPAISTLFKQWAAIERYFITKFIRDLRCEFLSPEKRPILAIG